MKKRCFLGFLSILFSAFLSLNAFAADCAANHYTDTNGVCTPCPANSHSNGRDTLTCTCDDGYSLNGDMTDPLDQETTTTDCQIRRYGVAYWINRSGSPDRDIRVPHNETFVLLTAEEGKTISENKGTWPGEGYIIEKWRDRNSEVLFLPGAQVDKNDVPRGNNWLELVAVFGCEAGYYGDGNTCTICPAGSYCPGDGQSYVCPENQFCPDGAAAATPCPVKSSTNGATGQTFCSCARGHSLTGLSSGGVETTGEDCKVITYTVTYAVGNVYKVDNVEYGQRYTFSRSEYWKGDEFAQTHWKGSGRYDYGKLFAMGETITYDFAYDLYLKPVYGCAAGYYGDGTTCTPCPEHSTSDIGADYCMCDTGYGVGGVLGDTTTRGDACVFVTVPFTYYPVKGAHGLSSLRDYSGYYEDYTVVNGVEKFPAYSEGYVFDYWVNMNDESKKYYAGDVISGDIIGTKGISVYGVWHCAAGYYADGDNCLPCNAGEYCPGDTSAGKLPPVGCPEGFYCPDGADAPIACPDSHPLSNAGAVSQTECYAKCLDSEIPGGFMKPVNTTVAYPSTCQYAATSINCNLGYYIDWASVQCVECPVDSMCYNNARYDCPSYSGTNGLMGQSYCTCADWHTVDGTKNGETITQNSNQACQPTGYMVYYLQDASQCGTDNFVFADGSGSYGNYYTLGTADVGVDLNGKIFDYWAVCGYDPADGWYLYEAEDPSWYGFDSNPLSLYPVLRCPNGTYGENCDLCPEGFRDGAWVADKSQCDRNCYNHPIPNADRSWDHVLYGTDGSAQCTYNCSSKYYWDDNAGACEYCPDGYRDGYTSGRDIATQCLKNCYSDVPEHAEVDGIYNIGYGSNQECAYKCSAGYYGDANNCQLCPDGQYCPGGEVAEFCPENSVPNAATEWEVAGMRCNCLPGYTVGGSASGSTTIFGEGDVCSPATYVVSYHTSSSAPTCTYDLNVSRGETVMFWNHTDQEFRYNTQTITCGNPAESKGNGYKVVRWKARATNNSYYTDEPVMADSEIDMNWVVNHLSNYRMLDLEPVYGCAAGYYGNGETTCTSCEAGSYCPGSTTIPTASKYECPAGSYCPENSNAPTACPTGYTSDAGATQESECYLITEPGKSVETAGAEQTDCPADNYCTGGVRVYYGKTGGKTVCLAHSNTQGVTGAVDAGACFCNEWYTSDGTVNGGNQPVAGTLGCALVPEFEITVDMNGYSSFPVTITAGGKFCVQYWLANDGDCFENTTGNVKTFYYTYPPISEATIKIRGDATGYDPRQPAIIFSNPARIKSIRGNLGAVFPTVNGQSPRFDNLLSGAYRVTELPHGLFDGVTTSAPSQFASAFAGMTGLTSIPGDLFSGITGAPAENAFKDTFTGATNIASVTDVNGNSTNYIPVSFFGGLTESDTYNSDMFSGAFNGTGLAMECPTGTANPNPFYADGIAPYVVCETVPDVTVSYNLNGGTGSYATRIENYAYGATVGEPKPSYVLSASEVNRPGYVFTKWSFDEEGSTTVGSFTVTEDTVLYAIWEPCVENTFKTDTDRPGNACTACPANSGTNGQVAQGVCTCDAGFTLTGQSDGGIATTSDECKLVSEFTIKTTEIAAQTDFSFSISAAGSYIIDWGDGEVLPIEKEDTDPETYTHTYAPGTYTIGMAGDATAYNSSNAAAISFESNKTIAELDGSLGAIFGGTAQPYMFYRTFEGCTNLTTIPGTLFDGITDAANYMFSHTFDGCKNLTTIPGTLFDGVTNGAGYMFAATFFGASLTEIPEDLFSSIKTGAGYMFYQTFYNCKKLKSIPGTLFADISVARNMFQYTFYGCSSLEAIPENLFATITKPQISLFGETFGACTKLKEIPNNLFKNIKTTSQALFARTFKGCTGLTNLPEGLFSHIEGKPQANAFLETFSGCTNLSGYIPADMFVGLNNSGYTAGPMANIFNNTALDTVCPEGMYQYITGFEEDWSGKVACTICPLGYHENARAKDLDNCTTKCAAGYAVLTPNGGCENVGAGKWIAENTVNYGGVSSVNSCAGGLTTIGYGSGADEVADCGRILHIGENKLYLRSAKKNPDEIALNVRVGDSVFYGNMTTEDKFISNGATQSLKINVGGVQYCVYDDSAM